MRCNKPSFILMGADQSRSVDEGSSASSTAGNAPMDQFVERWNPSLDLKRIVVRGLVLFMCGGEEILPSVSFAQIDARRDQFVLPSCSSQCKTLSDHAVPVLIAGDRDQILTRSAMPRQYDREID